jgi:Tol biopolymer transport system component
VDSPRTFSVLTRFPFRSEIKASRSGESAPVQRIPGFYADQLWVADRNGSGLRQLTKMDTPEIGYPAWSPDGKWIVFEAPLHHRGWPR